MDHGIGVAFKVHRDLYLFHQLCQYVYRTEQGLLFQGEYIDCMQCDIALLCSAGDGRVRICLLALCLDLCGRSSPLACTLGRLRYKWMRAIEQASSESCYPFGVLGRRCSHWWDRINHHGLRDNAGGVVACDVLMQPLGYFQTLFAVGF